MTVNEFIRDCKESVRIRDNHTQELSVEWTNPCITEACREDFKDVLEMEMEPVSEGRAVIKVDEGGTHAETEARFWRAVKFFRAAAGYCAEEDYNRWFTGKE